MTTPQQDSPAAAATAGGAGVAKLERPQHQPSMTDVAGNLERAKGGRSNELLALVRTPHRRGRPSIVAVRASGERVGLKGREALAMVCLVQMFKLNYLSFPGSDNFHRLPSYIHGLKQKGFAIETDRAATATYRLVEPIEIEGPF